MNGYDHGRPDSKTHYEVLCVKENATYAQIRSQYRLALISLHPDKTHRSDASLTPSNLSIIEEPEYPNLEVGNKKSEFVHVGDPNYNFNQVGENTLCPNFGQRGDEDNGCQGNGKISDLNTSGEIENGDGGSLERFLRVQKAWEVLKDEKSSEAYDYELQALRRSVEIVENEIELEEMSIEDDRGSGEVEYIYPCRCGDYFVIGESELVEMGFRASQWDGNNDDSGLTINGVSTESREAESGMRAPEFRGQDSREERSSARVEKRSVTFTCGSCSSRVSLFFDAVI